MTGLPDVELMDLKFALKSACGPTMNYWRSTKNFDVTTKCFVTLRVMLHWTLNRSDSIQGTENLKGQIGRYLDCVTFRKFVTSLVPKLNILGILGKRTDL